MNASTMNVLSVAEERVRVHDPALIFPVGIDFRRKYRERHISIFVESPQGPLPRQDPIALKI
jgi:hypothetical protein